MQPQPLRPAAAWPDAHGELTSEDGSEKQPPAYKAFAFNDAERADLSAAGGLGMLGYRFHRRTTVNWCVARLHVCLNVSRGQGLKVSFKTTKSYTQPLASGRPLSMGIGGFDTNFYLCRNAT